MCCRYWRDDSLFNVNVWSALLNPVYLEFSLFSQSFLFSTPENISIERELLLWWTFEEVKCLKEGIPGVLLALQLQT